MRYLIIALTIVSIWGCSGNGKQKNKNLLPVASGRAGDIILVMDSTEWNGALGKTIRTTFNEEVSGLPRDEKMFKINYVDPSKLTGILKSVKNMIFVMTLEDKHRGSKLVRNYFSKTSIEKIQKDPNLFVHLADDEFARNQKVMYLFGQTSEQLINKIKENKDRLQEYFNKAERDRLEKGLFKAKEVKGSEDMLVKDHNCFMRIPFGYQLVVNEPGFVWFRQINAESDKDLFITYKEYTSEDAFTQENLIAYRDSVANKQLFEDPEDKNTFILTETTVPYIPVTTEQLTMNGHYSMKMKGLWRTNNISMGGPFIGYLILDEEMNRLYYIEGFVYSPGKDQREFMREMEVILSTFRTKESK